MGSLVAAFRRKLTNDNPTKEMSFGSHLEELRGHILRCIYYVTIFSCLCWWQYDTVYYIVDEPLRAAFAAANMPMKMLFTHIFDPFFFKFQLVLSGGVILGLPFIMWEFWQFVAPGLYAKERRYVGPLLPFSILLALAGAFTIWLAIPKALRFLLMFLPQSQDIQLMQDPKLYFLLLARMMAGMAIAFQQPILFYILAQLDLVSSRGLVNYWRHAILANFFVAALVTPTADPFNMSVVAVPLCALYLVSIALVWRIERKRARTNPPTDGGGTPPPETPVEPGPPPAEPVLQLEVAPEPPAPVVVEPEPPVMGRALMGPLALPESDTPAEDEALFDPEVGP